MRLGSLIRPDLIFPDLPATDRTQTLRILSERTAQTGAVRDADSLFQKLLEREQLGSTGVGGGVAIPHCKLAGLARGLVALGVAPDGVDFGAVDGKPVCLFFLVISPGRAPGEHLQVLASISRWVKSGRHVQALLDLHDARAIYDFLQQEEGAT